MGIGLLERLSSKLPYWRSEAVLLRFTLWFLLWLLGFSALLAVYGQWFMR